MREVHVIECGFYQPHRTNPLTMLCIVWPEMLPNHNTAFLIPPLFAHTPARCDMPASTDREGAWADHHHQQRLNCLHSFPNSAKKKGGARQSCCGGQFFLQIKQRQTSAGREPVQGQSQYWYSLMDREGCQFRQLVHRSLSQLTNSSFLSFSLCLLCTACLLLCPVPLWTSSTPLCMSQTSHWPGVKTKRVGCSLSHLFYPSLLYLQPRWQGIQFVSWTYTLLMYLQSN